MNIQRRRNLALVISFLSLGALSSAFAASAPGGACAKAGQITTVNGQKLTCSLIWVAAKSSTVPKPKTTPAKTNGIQRSKGFELVSIQFNDSGVISGATARIQNVTGGSLNATFVVTIFGSDGVTAEATMNGTAIGVAAGETTTVQFITTSGSIPSGTFKYAFQTSVQF